MVAPSGSGMVMQSSTLPSLRSSFSGTCDAVLDRGDRLAQRPPGQRVVEQRLAPGFHGLDMRLLLQRFRRQLPHFRESRIEQLRAAIAAEHRDRFGEIVERLALDPDQAVKSPRQVEAFGDVVEQIGDAAFRDSAW